MTTNPGRAMTIYDIPGIVKIALLRAVTHQNIVSGFECTGIFPFNPDVFQEYEFLPSSVTDRENPSTSANDGNSGSEPSSAASVETVEPETNINKPTTSTVSGCQDELRSTLQTIRPLPKAAPRQQSRRGRKRRKSAVLTDSPVMRRLSAEQTAARERREKKDFKKKKEIRKSLEKNVPRKRGRPRKNAETER